MKFSNFAINLNTKCNLRCDYCFIPHEEKTGEEASYIVLSKFRKLVEDFGEKPIKIDIFGTEPLISWDKLVHLANMADMFDWKIGVTTNGTLITKERAELMKQKDIGVLLSYDGSRKSHNRFRKFASGQGTWKKVVEGISNLRRAGVKYGCAMLVTPENLPYLLHNVKSAAARGFEYIALNPQFLIGKKPHPTGYDWDLLRQKYRATVEWAVDHEIRLLFSEGAFMSYANGLERAGDATCGACKGSIAMDWDGSLYICHHTCGREEFKIGYVDTGPIEEIIMSYRMRDVNECHLCPVFTQRGSCGHCWVLSLDLTGDMRKVPEQACMWASILHDVDLSVYHEKIAKDSQMTGVEIP